MPPGQELGEPGEQHLQTPPSEVPLGDMGSGGRRHQPLKRHHLRDEFHQIPQHGRLEHLQQAGHGSVEMRRSSRRVAERSAKSFTASRPAIHGERGERPMVVGEGVSTGPCLPTHR
jgi:hypothetical protein